MVKVYVSSIKVTDLGLRVIECAERSFSFNPYAREPSTRPCYSKPPQVALSTSRDGEFTTFLVKRRRDLFPSVSQCFFMFRETCDRLQIQQ